MAAGQNPDCYGCAAVEKMILQPLKSLEAINERLGAVEEIKEGLLSARIPYGFPWKHL